MSPNTKLRVLLIGPQGPHVTAHIDLISQCVGELLWVTNRRDTKVERCRQVVTDFSLKSASNWRNTPRFIRAQIRAFKPDVIHVHQANSYAFYTHLANRSARVPVVLTLWGSDVLVLPQRSCLFKALVRYNLKKANQLTADAQFLADSAERLVGSRLPMRICNFGVEPSSVTLPKEKVIYSNRNHEPLYRINSVIEMFKRFLESSGDLDWRLIIAGRGSQTSNLKALVNALELSDNVQFVGFLSRPENDQWYARAQIFASLPTSDATAISLLEAMYHGCVPVVTDLPANREWITHQSNGVLVRSVEENAFSLALQLDAHVVARQNRLSIETKGLKSVAQTNFCEVLAEAVAPSSGRVGRKA